MQENNDGNLHLLRLHWRGHSSCCLWLVVMHRWKNRNTKLTMDSFPFVFEDFRLPEPAVATLALFRDPRLVSLAASVNLVEDDPDFASKARTAGIPMEPFEANLSFLTAASRTAVLLRDPSNLTFLFPLSWALSWDSSSSSENARMLSESDSSGSSSRGLLVVGPFAIEEERASRENREKTVGSQRGCSMLNT